MLKKKEERRWRNTEVRHTPPSRNLKQPIIKKELIWERDFFRTDAKSQKGYYIDKRHDEENGGVRKGYTVTGYPFMEYILVQNTRTWDEDEGG